MTLTNANVINYPQALCKGKRKNYAYIFSSKKIICLYFVQFLTIIISFHLDFLKLAVAMITSI